MTASRVELALERGGPPDSHRAVVLATLDAVATTTSSRDACVLHRTTPQDRSSPLGAALGWDVREPTGRLRLRLQLALVLRRAARSRP